MASEKDGSGDGLSSLKRRIDAAKQAADPDGAKSGKTGTQPSALGAAMKLSTEIVAAVGVGAVIGWQLDKLFDIAPLFLIVFLGLGFAAAIRNLMRATATRPPGRGDAD